MARTGPQRYPGASTAYWYQDNYPGSPMEVNVVVLHTTEGTSLPSYGGGTSAPNLTAVPDFGAKRLRWYQHFDIDTSSRALRNLSGGVETNTLNVCQVELVGTCDPATHQRWGSTPHIYWPEAPDWALAELATFLRWMNAEHKVPLTGPSSWPSYPSSYANGAGQRMSGTQWNNFSGVCGHMHVPENDHGDPGSINFTKLLAMAKGTTTPSEEAPVADLTKDDVYLAVWHTAKLSAPNGTADAEAGKKWQAQVHLRDINNRVRSLQQAVSAQNATIAELVKTVVALSANVTALDPDALVARITGEIEKVTIRLDVPDA